MQSPVGAVWRDLVRAAVLLGGLGPPGVIYTADPCAEYVECLPQARNCAEAATGLFGGAAVGLLFESAGFALAGGSSDGVGGLLSGGIVSAVAAVVSGSLLLALLARAERISRQGEPASAQA